MSHRTHRSLLLTLIALAFTFPAGAETLRRYATDVTGDFILIGNTLGQTCGSPRPTVGTVGQCVERSRFPDLSPDLFWRAETSSAVADLSVTPGRLRSAARPQPRRTRRRVDEPYRRRARREPFSGTRGAY